jgi:hypothetical protein
MLTIDIDLTQFHQRVEQTKRQMRAEQERAVKTAAREGRDEAKRGDWKDKSGELRRSIQVTAFSWSGVACWSEYRTQKNYALWVEDETAAHWIFPKAAYNAPASSLYPGQTRRGRGKGLHEHVVGRGIALRWKEGDTQFFARSVYHPGTMGFHFMRDSAKHARAVLVRELDRGFTNLRSIWAT